MTALLLISGQALADQVYIIRKGDTLYTIAQRYSTSISAIEKANGIDASKPIHPDQKLTIPSDVPAKGSSVRIARDKIALIANDRKAVATLSKGTEVTFLQKKGDEYAVKLSDGRMGCIPIDAIEPVGEQGSPSPVIDRHQFGREIARTAYAFRGTRYRRGGMSSRGFDCSGFVKYIYESKGIKLPRTSYDMYRCGTPVTKDNLREGDLVFFANTYRRGISHVGMYVGDGQFIHASTSRGGVRVDRLEDAYYRNKYAGARRIKEDS